jgi:hypothetical protein
MVALIRFSISIVAGDTLMSRGVAHTSRCRPLPSGVEPDGGEKTRNLVKKKNDTLRVLKKFSEKVQERP